MIAGVGLRFEGNQSHGSAYDLSRNGKEELSPFKDALRPWEKFVDLPRHVNCEEFGWVKDVIRWIFGDRRTVTEETKMANRDWSMWIKQMHRWYGWCGVGAMAVQEMNKTLYQEGDTCSQGIRRRTANIGQAGSDSGAAGEKETRAKRKKRCGDKLETRQGTGVYYSILSVYYSLFSIYQLGILPNHCIAGTTNSGTRGRIPIYEFV